MSEDANRGIDALDLPDLLDVRATLVDETEFAIDLLHGLKQQLRRTEDIGSAVGKVESQLKSVLERANKMETSRIRSGVHYDTYYNAITDVVEVREGIQQLRVEHAAAKQKTRREASAMTVRMSTMLLRQLEILEKTDSSLSLMTLIDTVLGLLIKTAARVNTPLGPLGGQLEETLVGLSGSNDTDLLDEINQLIEIDRKKNFPSTAGAESDAGNAQSDRDMNSNSPTETDSVNDSTHFPDSNPGPELSIADATQGVQLVPDDEVNISEDIPQSARSRHRTIPRFSPGAGPSSRPYSSRRTPEERDGGPGPPVVGSEAEEPEVLPKTGIHPTSSTSSESNNPGTPSRIQPLRSGSIAESKPTGTERRESFLKDLKPEFKLDDGSTQSPVNPAGFIGAGDNSREDHPVLVPDESIGSFPEIQPDIEQLMAELDVAGTNPATSDGIEEESKEERTPLQFPPEYERPKRERVTPEMFLAIGAFHFSGEVAGVDYEKAFLNLTLALRGKMYAACYMLGKLYAGGHAVQRDMSTAFNLFARGAKSGDAKCFYELGRCFEFGFAVTRNLGLMRRFYDAAVAKGCVEAKAHVGYHKLHGHLYDQDAKAATDLIDDAVGEHNSDARAFMALCILRGIVYDRRLNYAKELLDDACEPSRDGRVTRPGSRPGIMLLAKCTMDGVFEARNLIEAARLYKQLSDRAVWAGDPARVQYARCLLFGIGVPRDYAAGLQLLRESTLAHVADPWALLGVCYRDGVGVRKNLNQAFEYFMQAACCVNGITGIAEAHFALGEMYETGSGVQQDIDRAVHHYMSAANRLHTEAQFRVGKAYETGLGIEKSLEQSYQYYRLAARAGHTTAQRMVGERYAKGLGVQKCLWGAHKMLENAAAGGDQRARKLLTRTQVKLVFSRMRVKECECCAPAVKPRNAHFFEHREEFDFMNY